MNKKIKNLFLAGALVLGLAGVAVSCTDYDDDINKLQSDLGTTNSLVSQLKTTVDGLQAKIDAGAVISSVTKVTTGNGGWLFTLSNGDKYEVSNGAPGTDGTVGPQGPAGKNGKDGKDGKWYVPNDSTGLWDIYEMVDGVETVVGSTDYSYLPAVDPNEPTIAYDAEKKAIVITDGEDKYEISLVSGGETSLVFIPQVYVDGVEGFESISYSYYPLYVKEKTLDTKNEIWAPDAKKDTVPVQLSPAVDVQFHVNVSDAILDDTFEYEFIWKDKKFLSTRGQASEDFAVIPTFKSFADGVLTLGVEVFGKEATEEYITTMALQATKGAQTVTSDYFTVFSGVIENLRIADPQALSKKIKGVDDEHYRRGTVGISKVDAEDAFLPDKEVWTEGEVEQDQAHAYCDTAVAYTGKLDLKTITLLHYTMGTGEEEEELDVPAAPTKAETDDAETELCFEMTPEEMEGYGLTFKYEIVKNYKIGKPVTDQAEFVTLDDGVFTPKVFTLDGTPAAIGRTPIVRVTVLDGTNVVEVAYIKVYIKQTEDGPAPTFTLTPRRDAKDDGENIFRFKCNGDKLITTVKDMNEIVYTGMQMSAKVFHAAYDTLVIAPQKDTIGTVRDSIVDKSQGTHVIVWELTAEELWENSGKDVEILARYQKKTDETLYVDIKLTASVEEIGKSVTLVYTGDPKEGNYDVNYWYKNPRGADPITGRFNVNVPAVDETVADNCQFENDINALFKTYETGTANAGKIKVENVDSVAYFFCKKDVEAIKKIDDLNVKFRVGENLDSLFASIVDDKGKEILPDTLVAWIENAPVTKGKKTIWNTFHYVKDGRVADTLLNTNKMYTYLNGEAYLCTSNADIEIDPLPLKFNVNGQELDHFEVDILQPVFVSTVANDNFTDAVNFGAKGSYIKIEDLLDPYDWRSEYPVKGVKDEYFFSYKNDKVTPKIDNKYFWDYYGPFEIAIDIDNAEDDLNGERTKLKANIILTQTEPGVTKIKHPTRDDIEVTLPANKQGFLTYLNNTANVQTFNIFVKAKVKYGFGTIISDWITIKVNPTEGQPTE